MDGVEPLQTLKEYRYDSKLRGVMFGQNAIIVEGVGGALAGRPDASTSAGNRDTKRGLTPIER